MTETKRKDAPLYIKIDPSDNVAIIVNSGGLPAGTEFPDGLILKEHVPEAHKVALTDLGKGDTIIRYGEVIGYAKAPIEKGRWIDESLVDLPVPPDLDQLSVATRIPRPQSPLGGYTFEGYRNPDGTVGSKNILGISTSVQCTAGVIEYAVRHIRETLLPKYPNVDNVVAVTHSYGCGVAINAPEAVVPIRTLQNLAVHPNLGSECMIVALGCEKLRPETLLPKSGGTIITLQEEKGFAAMTRKIISEAETHLNKLNERKREKIPLSEIVIGVQCGGSDAFSGVTANPAVGYAADLLVRAGATVLFSEVTEVRDAVHLLTPRAINKEVGNKIIHEMKWYDRYLESGGADRSANPAPGNKKGGLANIMEKSLGSIIKSGSSAISGVLAPGEKVNTKGLIFAATPASDFICGTQQLASGIHLQVFTTGRGTPYGLAMIPVIKVGTRTTLAEQWPDLIDINAGRIATGDATIEDVGWEIFHMIIESVSGKKQTWAERWKLHNDLCVFNPAPVT